jgi:hypothetical protein
VYAPSWRNAVELVKEKDAWLCSRRPCEQIPHSLLCGTNVFVQQFGSLLKAVGRGSHTVSPTGAHLNTLPPPLVKIRRSRSRAFTLRKLSPHSFATALASSVLPQPGGPYNINLGGATLRTRQPWWL